MVVILRSFEFHHFNHSCQIINEHDFAAFSCKFPNYAYFVNYSSL